MLISVENIMVIRDDVLEIVNRYADVPITEAHVEEPFNILGIDSVNFIQILIEIEEKYCFEFDDEYLVPERLRCIMSLVQYIKLKAEDTSDEHM